MSRISIVALDLSLTSTGVASDSGLRSYGQAGWVENTLRDDLTRLEETSRGLLTLVLTDKPGLVVVESPALGTHKGGRDHLLAGFWWTMIQLLDRCGIPIATVTPSSLKKYATGVGNAAKDAVLKAVTRRLPDYDPKTNDEVDALVLYAMALDWVETPLCKMPDANRMSLLASRWPAIPQIGKEEHAPIAKARSKKRR